MVESNSTLQLIDGILVPIKFDAETFRSALNYKAQPDDIFISVYPKSGTTWMEVILYTLMNDGESFDKNMAEYFARTPYLDVIGERGLNNMHRPCVIKTHLSLDRISYHEKAKYVCIMRNPKDVCVSAYYYSIKLYAKERGIISFDSFFEAFISGNVCYGDYFEHLRSNWQHRNHSNVFITSYEELKRDFCTVIGRLAQFMNIELTANLLDRIVANTSFEYMKERFDKTYVAQACVAVSSCLLAEPLPIEKPQLKTIHRRDKVRKGVVGDWSSIMSENQYQRLDKIYAEKTVDMPGLDKLFS